MLARALLQVGSNRDRFVALSLEEARMRILSFFFVGTLASGCFGPASQVDSYATPATGQSGRTARSRETVPIST
jgi:hypothetical protein